MKWFQKGLLIGWILGLILVLFVIFSFATDVTIYKGKNQVIIDRMDGLWCDGKKVIIKTSGTITVISGTPIPMSMPKVPKNLKGVK